MSLRTCSGPKPQFSCVLVHTLPFPHTFIRKNHFGKDNKSCLEYFSSRSSIAQLCLTFCNPAWTAACQASLSITNSQSPPKPVYWVGYAIQPSHPLSSPSPPALNLSQHQGLFKWVSSSHQVAKVLEFQLQYQSFQWTPRTDLLWDGLVGSPCSPRDSQESSLTSQFKASILLCSGFFIVQLSHPYTTTGKTIALTRWTFVGKVMSLLFNMLFRGVITFLPRSKCLLISWLQSPSAVILEPRKIKSATVSPSICHEVMGPWSDGRKPLDHSGMT